MFKLDENLLRELGLGALPATEKNRMLSHIYETLEMRVGMKLAEQMTNEQLDEFEAFIDRNDEAGALKWLETNFPNYKQVVADQLEALKAEVKAAAPQILAASQQAAAQMPQQPQQYPQMPQQQMPPQQQQYPSPPPVPPAPTPPQEPPITA
jgi:predicted RNA-binding Zn ribbon-like protein